MPLYEVNEVHHHILFTAADIANRRFKELDFISPSSNQTNLFETIDKELAKRGTMLTDIYRADPIQSEKGGLCLSIDPKVYETIPTELRDDVHRIGREAIKQALIENQKQFVGLILGEARQGRNYFDRFDPPDQGRLF